MDRRNDDRQGRAIERNDVVPIEVMVARIVHPRTPRVELGLGGRVERRREGHDRADVQVDIGPSVEALADSRHERIVDGGVAQRTCDADARELPEVVDRSLHAHDRIEAQQFDSDGRVAQINIARLKRRDDLLRQGLDIDLQADCQRCRRVDDRRNDLVHP